MEKKNVAGDENIVIIYKTHVMEPNAKRRRTIAHIPGPPLHDHSNIPSTSSSSLSSNASSISSSNRNAESKKSARSKRRSMIDESDKDLEEMGVIPIHVEEEDNESHINRRHSMAMISNSKSSNEVIANNLNLLSSVERRCSSSNRSFSQRSKWSTSSEVKSCSSPNGQSDVPFMRFRRLLQPKNLYNGPNQFDKLSNEIIMLIFNWLPQVSLVQAARVCKRFKDIAMDPLYWKRINLGMKHIPPGGFGHILNRGAIVVRASKATISNPIFEQDGIPTFQMSTKLCMLKYLDLSASNIAVKDLEDLMDVCTDLEKLALESLEVSTKACQNIAKNKDLNTLHLGMCTGLNAQGLEAILDNCPDLIELNLAWTNLDSETLDSLVKYIQINVERLNLSGCRESLTDQHVAGITSFCTSLKELDLSDSLNITSDTVQLIINNLLELEILSLSRCYSISPFTLLDLKRCRSLNYLNIFGIFKDSSLKELGTQLPGISINKLMFSCIARPTVGIRKTSIWNIRVRE